MDVTQYTIKQISVFSENKPGRLAAIAGALQDEGINILAFSIAEANGFGVVRALVNKPEAAYTKLNAMGFMVSFTDVIAVKMRDVPGGLFEMAAILSEAGINIEYSYAYSGREAAVLILRVDQVDAAVEKILARGGTLLGADEF
ncbi:ACT domain-containing protein [Methanogenium organophilum]|uniref:ACT domain-containing protein n=1 Tax=Methanogenium organophilum TaxID=2199 RepID=A0A9X9S2K1_METOG|nr:ACT domain-containing protein [Methanogenium organophilum]WAI00571.1 ACT domain-containing protein [Methanogenium organophilum]